MCEYRNKLADLSNDKIYVKNNTELMGRPYLFNSNKINSIIYIVNQESKN